MSIPLSYEYERDDYYFYPNSSVLKNKFGIMDDKVLMEAERKITALKLAELEHNPMSGELNFDYLRKIHRFLFGDIYEWAGENRKIDISRGNIFCMHELIDVCMNQLMDELKAENYLNSLDRDNKHLFSRHPENTSITEEQSGTRGSQYWIFRVFYNAFLIFYNVKNKNNPYLSRIIVRI